MSEKRMPEQHEIEVSALLDDELRGEELRQAVDALVDDEALRRFWKQSRRLSQALATPSTAERAELPDGLWDTIERRSGLGRARVIPMPRMTTRAWAAAASILLILGLSAFGIWQLPSPASATEKTVQLASKEGKMTEDRFLELTTELLQADPRYHRKMLEVLEAVNQQAYNRDTGERRTDETRDANATDDTPEASPSPTSGREPVRDTSSGPLELNLW